MKEYITDLLQDGLIGFDISGTVSYANKSALDILSYTLDELQIKNYSGVLEPKNGSKSFERIREKLLFGEKIPSSLTTFTKINGDTVDLITKHALVKNNTNEIIGISVYMHVVNEFDFVISKANEVLETAPDGIIVVNNTGHIVMVNKQTEKLFGYVRNELLGKEIEILVPSRFLGKHKHHRDQYIDKPKSRNMGQNKDLYGKRKDGTNFPVEISLSPLNSDGKQFVSAAIRDISDRKRAENKFKSLLESAPDAMVIVDQKGLITLVNAQVENIFGYTREELIGQKVEILIPSKFHGNHPSHREGFHANPNVRPMGAGKILLGLRKNGEEFPVEISLSPLETEDGRLVSAAIRDITERKQAEEQMNIMNQQLMSKNKELEQFAYIASHDLQEPLRTVSNFTDLIKLQYHDLFDEKGKKSLQFISDATTRMQSLIKDLLEFSRIGLEIEKKPINVTSLMENLVQDISSKIMETKSKIVWDKLPIIFGAETEIRLLFQNLITNAIKFKMPDDDPLITIKAEEFKEHWEFRVEDNGIGIDQKHQGNIFKIFQRIHDRNVYPGTGIGLAHVQKIVKLHGGTIEVKSDLGHGSIFIFTLKKTKS
ncbi:MAG: PAS domain S-box-containing protein [Luteibaculaceae bacterium]|jgi:PAS domain S-box-containing protein